MQGRTHTTGERSVFSAGPNDTQLATLYSAPHGRVILNRLAPSINTIPDHTIPFTTSYLINTAKAPPNREFLETPSCLRKLPKQDRGGSSRPIIYAVTLSSLYLLKRNS
jgi:hypothetical protein